MQIYEQKVIGGIIAGFVAPTAVVLAPEDFRDEDMGASFAILRQLEAKGVTIDSAAVKFRLDEDDLGFLSTDDFQIMANSVDSASVVYEAVERIKGASLKTQLLSGAARIALHDKKSGSQVLSDLRDLVDSAERTYSTPGKSFVFLKDISTKTRGVIEDLHANRSYAVSTGFPRLDELLIDGFSRGDSHIIVGHTGHGKSALAINCVICQARAGKVVGVVSREMSDTENHMRIISGRANIPRNLIRKGLSVPTRNKLLQTIDELDDLPIAFDTQTSNVEDLRPQVRRMVEEEGMEILYVDYLQLLASKANQATRANEVQTISRTLKLIAMENRIPVVSLCQFNRGAMNANIFDILGHLKESSGIEQDASTLSYIQIEQVEDGRSVRDAKITILKNRNGATFKSVEFRYHGPTFTFTEKIDDGC